MSTSWPESAARDGRSTTGAPSPTPSPVPSGGSRSRGRALLDLVGYGFFPLAFVSRLPFAMTVVGTLTLVSDVRGSLAQSGAVSAMTGIGTAVFGPMTGSFADRYGQRRVLLIGSGVNVAALVGFVLMTYSAVSIIWVAAVGFLVGASAPQVAPLSRTRLITHVTARTPADGRRDPLLSLVMSYESVADESAFVLGPVVIGLLATAFGAGAPLLAAGLIAAVFVVAFAFHRTAALPQHHEAAAGPVPAAARSLLRPRIMILPLGMFLVGAFFGSTLTALTLFMRDRGMELSTGIVYGGMSIGSVATAILIVFVPERLSLRTRWLLCAAIVLAASGALVAATSVVTVTVALACAGCGVGGVIVTLFVIAGRRTPQGRTATLMTTLACALVVGQALWTALGGSISQAHGSTAGFLLSAATAAALILAGLTNHWSERRRSADGAGNGL
ncbi:MFS transporter [Streptomyces cavernicola]|uniref:MFS transporter n=1 Tax=Streptomyces cavernicola TaxID=3043613 RepID=A0ABT6S5K5_9ACTN|nr:MFS transporter [Streptomyces sp. B-S-A6]MDI3403381.1 MFS transporter [Streptomyces sp. B-S-A6]